MPSSTTMQENTDLGILLSFDDLIQMRRQGIAHHEDDLELEDSLKDTWRRRVAAQGPWDPQDDPGFSLNGAVSQPMPVKITATAEFQPFFEHIRTGGTHADVVSPMARKGNEQAYDVELLEFPRGVLYADRRMDLCKQVLGPPSLPRLLDALRTNDFVRHFLFGNNIIGPSAAKRIAAFVTKRDQMETWYLAGNCISADAFKVLVDSWITSTAITNIWLKRNPLGPTSVDDIFRLITWSPNLRTLDLDQTSLSDDGVARLFSLLAEHVNEHAIPLRHIYLNGVGIGVKAATQIAAFLSAAHCQLVSLYLSHNPLGSEGAIAVSHGISSNESLERLSLQSVGMSDTGAIAILEAACKADGSGLRLLDIGQAYATKDLNSRFNWYTDAIVPPVMTLITRSRSLHYLDLGYTQCTQAGLNKISHALIEENNHRLLYYHAKGLKTGGRDYATVKAGIEAVRMSNLVAARLAESVRHVHDGMSYADWWDNEKRFVKSPRDVRLIDSVYRNRDAGLARRGQMVLKKQWDQGDETLQKVMDAD